MKRIVLLLVALLCGVSVYAQQSKADESLEFKPHWDLQLQGGVGYTVGESSSLGDLVSPAVVLSTNYRFHPAMGVRFGLGGWQGKGAIPCPSNVYKFNFIQLNADYKLDLTSLIGGYNHRRVANVYVLAGVGLNYGFNNDGAAAIAASAPAWSESFPYLWDKKMFVAGRFGAGIDFRVGERVMLNLEANANVLSDKFNSKRAENADWQLNLLAGVSYSFGPKTRTSQKWIDEQEAIKAAELARVEREKAEAERLAKAEAERKAKEQAEREAKAEAEREEAARRAAAAVRQANIEEHSENVFFTIGSAVIRKAEAQKVTDLAQWLVANPDYSVCVVGYADKETGTRSGNLRLSERRANVVKALLMQAGVEESRIESSHVGDTEQPFDEAAKNRVVICTLE